MKLQLIYSPIDESKIKEFRTHTFLLRKQGKLEFVGIEKAEIALLFSSAALLEDVFCYQAFLMAQYKKLKIIPILMDGKWRYGDWKKEFSDRLGYHIIYNASFPASGSFIYNSSVRRQTSDPDGGWTEVAISLRKMIEAREKNEVGS